MFDWLLVGVAMLILGPVMIVIGAKGERKNNESPQLVQYGYLALVIGAFVLLVQFFSITAAMLAFVLATGVTFVIMLGGIDLSIQAMASLASVSQAMPAIDTQLPSASERVMCSARKMRAPTATKTGSMAVSTPAWLAEVRSKDSDSNRKYRQGSHSAMNTSQRQSPRWRSMRRQADQTNGARHRVQMAMRAASTT
mgnify:CR=1 FL=1